MINFNENVCELFFCLCFLLFLCSKEDVERYKQKDFLEEMLREMTGEFPALSQVFVTERDLYLARSLRNAASMLPSHNGKLMFWKDLLLKSVGLVSGSAVLLLPGDLVV